MEHLFVELVELLKDEPVKALLAICFVGCILILVNVVTHYLVESAKTRRQQREHVARHLKPFARVAGDLVSRIVEILILHSPSITKEIREFDKSKARERAKTITPQTMSRLESTAYRLIDLLAISTYFGRATAEVPQTRDLSLVEYFRSHKIAVALRGNLFRTGGLTTELQEEIAVALLDQFPEARAPDLSVGHFCSALREQKYDPEYLLLALQFLAVDSTPLANRQEINRSELGWQRIMGLAILGVYLIDFFEWSERNSQWEEQRLFLVRLLRQWNVDSVRGRYLYEPGDLAATSSYLDTYPSAVSTPRLVQPIVRRLRVFGIGPFVGRLAKRASINRRGARFAGRHEPKKVSGEGLRLQVQGRWHSLRLSDDLHSQLGELTTILKKRYLND